MVTTFWHKKIGAQKSIFLLILRSQTYLHVAKASTH